MNKKTLSSADLQLFAEMLMKINKSSMRTCQREAITALAAYRNKLYSKNGFLFKICCGGGKTLIEAFFILKEILKAEAEERKARICIASHRLLLNNQLLQNVYAILAAYGIKYGITVLRLLALRKLTTIKKSNCVSSQRTCSSWMKMANECWMSSISTLL